MAALDPYIVTYAMSARNPYVVELTPGINSNDMRNFSYAVKSVVKSAAKSAKNALRMKKKKPEESSGGPRKRSAQQELDDAGGLDIG